MPRSYTKRDILHYLDNIVIEKPGYFFMDLEHGYFFTANSRLSLFADDTRWAIVFEKSGFANRGARIELELNYFGNCLQNLDGSGGDDEIGGNSAYFTLVDSDALDEVEADSEELSPSATHVKLRGKQVSIPNTKKGFQRWISDISTREYPEKPSFQDLGRYLAFEYEDECRATTDELHACLPKDLPFIMSIDEWHHRAYDNYAGDEVNGDKPSSYETFLLIADVLVSGDPGQFQPTLAPTNHWTNWPEAGHL